MFDCLLHSHCGFSPVVELASGLVNRFNGFGAELAESRAKTVKRFRVSKGALTPAKAAV
jgi:hypothetical protein